MDAYHKKRILKELELFPLWKEKNKPSSELHLKPVEADSFFAFKINYTEGSLLLLSQNFASGTEEVAQDLFLNIAKFISTTIGINTFQKSHLLTLTKDQLSELSLKTPPKHVLAFGLNNDLFEEYMDWSYNAAEDYINDNDERVFRVPNISDKEHTAKVKIDYTINNDVFNSSDFVIINI